MRAAWSHEPSAEARQERWQQRQRSRHRQQHGDHRGDRQSVHEVDAGGEHPEQRDHHGRTGEQDRPPGGVHRRSYGAVGVPQFEVVLAEASDDEQRIVDPDAEPDHQRQLRRDVGHARYTRREPDQSDAGDQAETGGDQWHPRRGERSEREDQDEERGDHADGCGRTDAEPLGLFDHLTACSNPQARRVHRMNLVQHGLAGVVREQVGALVVVDRREGRHPVRRDLDRAAR